MRAEPDVLDALRDGARGARDRGLDDTVERFDPEAGTGTGFKFGPYHAQALLDKVREALYCYTEPDVWRKIQMNGMRADNSWQAAARKYVELYRAVART